ncbi:MAG: S-DNA-T family DNA segregation ATPase FtsK/SpoIIIE, partial [Myxococcota bacterium]
PRSPPPGAELPDMLPPPVAAVTRRRSARLEVDDEALVSGGDDGDGLVVEAVNRYASYELPHLGLLDAHERSVAQFDEAELQDLANILEQKLADFGVKGEVTAIRPGPVITTFEYLPAPGIKLSKISGLSDDIAMALKALRVRIVAPIPGKGVVGIEIPNKKRQFIWLRDILSHESFRRAKSALPMVLGKTVDGRPEVTDLTKMPHLLVGGTTGSGKSVGINAMLLSLLYTRTPEELRLILIDPKTIEFELYRDIPHLLHPVVVEPKLASAALKWACAEMDARYTLLARWKTRNIESYNRKVDKERQSWTPAKARRYFGEDLAADELPPPPQRMPYIVVVIDELADLMMIAAKDVEESIIRIAQKARAAGIHLIVATQRPSVNVITGLIKANMPSRIAFQIRTKVDSRTILDQNGAENLLGKGDMLFLPPGVGALERCHGAFVSDEEVRAVTDFLRAQGKPQYAEDLRFDDDEESAVSEEEYDELYDLAVAFVCREGKASTSMVQREFKIGYNRAARMIDIMERESVVGPADGARPRQILVNSHG